VEVNKQNFFGIHDQGWDLRVLLTIKVRTSHLHFMVLIQPKIVMLGR